jgi:toxin ParE1/3/4
MKIKWFADAINDLENLRDYIAADNPRAANKIAKLIIKSVINLLKQPHIGRPGRVQNTREFIVSKTPFLIIYRVKKPFIEILRVMHGARKWPQ